MYNYSESAYNGGDANEEEIQHYGVPGMKWGIHRGSRMLKSSNPSRVKKGEKILEKHTGKINKKIGKLDKKYNKLSKVRNKQMMTSDIKAAKLKNKSAKYKKKSLSRFTSASKGARLLKKAQVLDMKADIITARSTAMQAKMNKNRVIRERFNEGLNRAASALNNR